jgi:hypothetical protein
MEPNGTVLHEVCTKPKPLAQMHKTTGAELCVGGFGVSLRIDFTFQIYHSLPGLGVHLLHVDVPSDVGIRVSKLTVHGISATSATFSPPDLAKLPAQTVTATDHGAPVSFQGVLLTDVLAKVRTPTGEAFNKIVASYYVIAEAQDGYKAVFSWAEVDPSFTDRKLYIVTKRDGKPLSERDGPFELIVPGEKRYSGWVRQLKLLRIEPLPTASAYDSEQARWIAASLTDMRSIQVGMTRGELLKVFMTEGGISSRTWRRYVYRRCGYIKVDVEFAPAGDPKSTAENPDDRITRISKPFLE